MNYNLKKVRAYFYETETSQQTAMQSVFERI